MKKELEIGQVWHDYACKYNIDCGNKIDYYGLLLSREGSYWTLAFFRKADYGYLGSIIKYLTEEQIRKMQYIGDFNPEKLMIEDKNEDFKPVEKEIEPDIKDSNIRTTDNTWKNLI